MSNFIFDVFECRWDPEGDCEHSGEVEVVDLFPFSDQEFSFNGHSVHAMPICAKHRADHDSIIELALGENSERINEVLEMGPEERAKEHRERMS